MIHSIRHEELGAFVVERDGGAPAEGQ
jgi:hypothetical protein